MDKQRYDKGGNAGSGGVKFQVSLLTIFLLNALQKLKTWRLSTEHKWAGKFDDVVLEWQEQGQERVVLLQAKHKTKITFDKLMSTNSKTDDFSLPKYFLSYQEIKNKFKVKNVVVCTNASFNEKDLKFSEGREDSSESMLHCGDDNCLFYTFNDEVLSELKEKTQTYYRLNLQNKGIDESVITDENLKDFQQRLRFYFDYPPEKVTDKVIEKLLRRGKWHGKVSSLEIYSKVMDWFQQKDGEFLTETHAKAMFSEIRRDRRWQELEKCDLFFKNNDLNFQDSTRIFHVKGEDAYLLQEIRVYRALGDMKSKVLCIYPDDTIEDQKQLIEAFGLRKYCFALIIHPNISVASEARDMSGEISEILNNCKCKKVILLAGHNNQLAQQIELSCHGYKAFEQYPTFKNLVNRTQDLLLKKKSILFQGNICNLEELFASEAVEDYGPAIDSETLEKLIGGQQIRVGSEVRPLEEDIRHLYIDRSFVRGDEERGEGNIFEVIDKVVLIVDSAGMGKTTVLTQLANIIKRENPHLWILKIELNAYSRILKDFVKGNIKTISITDLLNSQEATRLNQFEKFAFSRSNKMVLLLDGVDEIGPTYTDLIINLIMQCWRDPIFAKIFVTTRPHLAQKLPDELQEQSFTLHSFTESNQINFLTSYWTHNLKLSSQTSKEKCERYARTLIGKMSDWTKVYLGRGDDYAAIPLQLRMLAEIFQEEMNGLEGVVDWQGCKEFVNGDEAESKLPENIDITRLYKLFVKKKRDVFVNKSNPSGNAAADQALNDQFEESLAYHRTLALEVILDERQCELFTCYKDSGENMMSNVLNIGIVQKVNDILGFIHRTFAEYFVAECLLMELLRSNQNADFQKLLIDEILFKPLFKVIRAFFNGHLQECVNDLSPDIFQKYQCLSYEVNVYNDSFSCPIHLLAAEGHNVAILQLLLKCVNFKIITGKETKITELRKDLIDRGGIRARFQEVSFGNRLELFKFLLQRGGVNIMDDRGWTPLHHAAGEGHLGMTKFLIEQGANINRRTDGFLTPLCKAIENGHFDIVKLLVEQGADIETDVKLHGKELYTAIKRNHPNIVTYIFQEILGRMNLDTRYPIIPFTAAYLGRLDLLKTLMENGVDVNSSIANGMTLIFGAALGGQLGTIEYLVRQGAKIGSTDHSGNTALLSVSESSCLTCTVKFLMALGIDINVKNNYEMTALNYAVEKGSVDTVELLVKGGATVNHINALGKTVIRIAAEKGYLEIVKLLAEHGADINDIDIWGRSVLHVVATQGGLDVAKCLVDLGADVSIKDKDNRTALLLAISNCQFEVIKFLVNCGSAVNSRDNDGKTSLHLTVSMNNCGITLLYLLANDYITDDINRRLSHSIVLAQLDIVKCLVQHRVNINISDNDGQTALYLAILHFMLNSLFYPCTLQCDTCLSVIKFLIEQGAKISVGNCNGKLRLAKELQRSRDYSKKRLRHILQLPVFKLLPH